VLMGAADQSGGGGDDGQPQCFGDEPHGELALTGVLAQPLGVAKLADHVPVATAAGANGGSSPPWGTRWSSWNLHDTRTRFCDDSTGQVPSAFGNHADSDTPHFPKAEGICRSTTPTTAPREP
jgi:hypothetical protein